MKPGAPPVRVHRTGAYDANVLACLTSAVPLPPPRLTRTARDRIDPIARSRWLER